MVALTTKSFGVAIADQFIDALASDDMNVNIYLAISHAEPWANDAAANTSFDCTQDKVSAWRGIYAGKKLSVNDVCAVVPRIDWAANTRYAAYTDNANTPFGDNFYIMSNTYNVYKCIENNAGANSTIQPTYITTSTNNKETDGYVWKYMYTLSVADRNKFLTPNWMPTRTLPLDDGSLQWDVQEDAIDGGLEAVFVANNGIGYNNTANVTITFTGDGTAAVGQVTLNISSQTVSNNTMTNPGTGYHYANA